MTGSEAQTASTFHRSPRGRLPTIDLVLPNGRATTLQAHLTGTLAILDDAVQDLDQS